MRAKYLLERLKEPSTWRGIIMIGVAAGLHITPDMANTIIAVGVGLAGLVGVVTPDKVGGAA